MLAAAAISRWTVRRLGDDFVQYSRALAVYHRTSGMLRLLLLVALAYNVFFSQWPMVLNRISLLNSAPGLAPLVGLAPYCVSLLLMWWLLYPVERHARHACERKATWTRGQFVSFFFRHQFLVLAIPLSILFLVFSVTGQYRAWFTSQLGTPMAADMVLGAALIIVFLVSPVMMRYVWTTSSLPDGPLRKRLLKLCDQIGLRVRDILVWHSDRMMANAAVMGIISRFRYILLSDALLESMTDDEIEAVFGHEAGHVRHHHIPYFIVFAVVSLLILQGIAEGLILLRQKGIGATVIDRQFVEIASVSAVLPLWLLGFGAISRRFERQADAFGAICAAVDGRQQPCPIACSTHHGRDDGTAVPSESLCAMGVHIFISALRKVADLNGVAIREWSWRHSSIASRIHFLAAQAGDVALARSFAKRIRIIKRALLGLCVVGLLVAGLYVWQSPRYSRQVNKNVFEPIMQFWQTGGEPDR